jgi:squalene-hopene/tetraprenyl-beta-curcumene cyclase
VPGGLGGIYPAMANSILAMRLLGYPDDHPLIQGQIKEIEALAVEGEDQVHYQPCPSPIWDTALAINALIETGLPADHEALRRAAEWLLQKQVLVRGDWQVKRPHVQPGGWAFQYSNDFYPDLDDTGMVLMALEKVRGIEPNRLRLAKERGLGWFLGLQCENGGWASFEADNSRMYLNHIPFADHGALLDPTTEDLTGRGLELLGTIGYGPDFDPVERAIDFIRHTQRHDGPWYGRWGVNYIYGTWSVLRGLGAVGVDPRHEYVQRAVRWLARCQNPDGGWGETCESYDDPGLAGKGTSMPSQTAWALLGLFAARVTSGPTVERGIEYLLRTQGADGAWEDPFWNGTGFPRVFMLKYHLYPKYFPLWALGVYRSTRG